MLVIALSVVFAPGIALLATSFFQYSTLFPELVPPSVQLAFKVYAGVDALWVFWILDKYTACALATTDIAALNCACKLGSSLFTNPLPVVYVPGV